jgi:ketosteroid isomerase-like protein
MVMDLVGEDSTTPTYWTSDNISQLDGWILDAVEEISLVTGCNTEEMRIPIRANRRYYKLDPGKGSSLLWIKHLRVEPQGRRLALKDAEALSREDYNWMTRTGTPMWWFPVGLDTMRIVPYPTEEGQLLEATVVTVPQLITLGEQDLPIEDHLIAGIAAYAVGTVMIQNRRLDKVSSWFTEYHKALGIGMSYSLNLTPKTTLPRGIGSVGISINQ